MKLSVLNDIHLEFSPLEPVITDADVLILAGDIFVLASLRQSKYQDRLEQFLTGLSDHYGQVYAISGNHEYYGSDINTSDEQIKAIYQSHGIQFLQNEMAEYNGIRFIGTTLWTAVDPIRSLAVQEHMSDYHVIKNNKHQLTVHDTDQLHNQMRFQLESMLSNDTKPTVVITHHAPSYSSISDHYRRPENSLLNSAFANRLDSIMDQYPNISLWAHGHVHNSCDYMVNQTRVICNPRGYPGEHQYSDWQKTYQNTFDIPNIG